MLAMLAVGVDGVAGGGDGGDDYFGHVDTDCTGDYEVATAIMLVMILVIPSTF